MWLPELKSFLLWCAIINYAILLLWFGMFAFTHDQLYELHSRWFKVPPDTFDALNYIGIAIYKIGIMLFVLVPLIALYIAFPITYR